jgi:hypothetical protein
MAIHAADAAAVHAVLELFRIDPVTLNADRIARELGERGFPVAPPVGDVGMTLLAGDRGMSGGMWLDLVVAAYTVERLVPGGSTAGSRELEREQGDKGEEDNESFQQHEPILFLLGNALCSPP